MNSTTDQTHTVFAFLDISDPLVAWLVYRGEMVSSAEVHENALSFWTTGYLRSSRAGGPRVERYRAELMLESIRKSNYPHAVSRLKGFYVFPDRESALLAAKEWGGNTLRTEFLAEVALRPGALTSRCDAEWITYKLGSQGQGEWAHDYFQGKEYSDRPIWEILVDGRGFVLGTELREAAYETIKVTWPASLPLLELARVGVELNSDLGLISAMVVGDGNRLEVKYAMNFIDAINPAFLECLAAFDGPKNTNDLRPDSELVRPDLRDRQFSL